MKKNLSLALAALLGLLFFFCGELAQRQINKPVKEPRFYSDTSRIVVCSKALEALGKIGDPGAKQTLARGLKSSNFIIRAAAVEAINRLGDKSAIPVLKKHLRDNNTIIRVLTAKTLLNFGEPGMEGRLLGYLNNNDVSIRALTVEQLGEFKYRYLNRIAQLLAKDKNDLVRIKAIQQLGINKFNPAMPLIQKALGDPNPRVRQAACVAISQLKDYLRFNYLDQMLKDKEAIVRSAAKIGMSEAPKTSGTGGGEKTDTLLILLKQDLDSNNPVLRVSSFVGLANLRDVKILPLLLKEVVLASNSSFIKKGAAKALRILKPYVVESFDGMTKSSALSSADLELSYKVNGKNLLSLVIESLGNPTSPLHADSVFILGELREEASLPALRAALFQDDTDIAASAAYVLGLFRDKGAVPYLIKVCKLYGL